MTSFPDKLFPTSLPDSLILQIMPINKVTFFGHNRLDLTALLFHIGQVNDNKMFFFAGR